MSPLTVSKQSCVEISGDVCCLEIWKRGVISCCYTNTQAHSTKQKKKKKKEMHTIAHTVMQTGVNKVNHTRISPGWPSIGPW